MTSHGLANQTIGSFGVALRRPEVPPPHNGKGLGFSGFRVEAFSPER